MKEAWLIEPFKWLHRHPEFETTAFLTDIDALPIREETGFNARADHGL